MPPSQISARSGLNGTPARPAAARMRPQFGSAPASAVLTNDERAMVCAKQVAQTIALSSLVKTALAGADPNWGRILAAAGRAGVPFNPDRAEIWLGGIKMYGPPKSASYSVALPLDERAA